MKQKGKIVNFIDVCRYFPIYFFAEKNQKHLKFFTDYQKLKKRGKDTLRQKNSLKERKLFCPDNQCVIVFSKMLVIPIVPSTLFARADMSDTSSSDKMQPQCPQNTETRNLLYLYKSQRFFFYEK